ncbi:MAG: type II toxin-antitoxin system HicB family antitoxin [Oscillospiraceae bacterium]|nr:type II toxin-antitoxin system HicB family antitoxin [Oscillospiraceae bacterium]
MENTMSHKGLYGSVEFSIEDNLFHGEILGLSDDLILYEGDSIQSLRQDFEFAVDSYLEFCTEKGKELPKDYKGIINVRIDPELHKKLTVYSLAQKKTMNHAIEEAIRNYVS